MEDFKDQYRSCFYMKGFKGNEFPIKFKSSPYNCIFMMHVLGRRKCGDHTMTLSIIDNKKEVTESQIQPID